MLRIQRQRLLQRLTPHADCLTGQPKHEVKADVLESSVPREFDALLHLRKVVDAPQHLQQCRLGCLHPH